MKIVDVLEIKKRLASGESQKSIADRFGVTRVAITHIKTERRWGHVALPA